ncbi:MAG: class I SAM-dependent methyltransferase [Patescibacteria group bacterium]
MDTDHKQWSSSSHEAGVEKFYGVGVENYGEYHNGYLNFGLWENGNTDYLVAAENLIRTMGQMVGLNAQSRLLDVACGMGPQDVFIAKTFGCQIDAVDLTWKHVEHARRRAQEAGLTDAITVHHGNATELPFADATFTQVQCVEGAEHFNTREKFLKEAIRVLKPGGVIILGDYTLKRQPKNVYEKSVVEAARILWHVPKANYETVESFGTTMERCGFKNVTVKTVGAETIPGYYFEARRPENRKQQAKIRGWLTAKLAFFVDYSVYKAFKDGLIEYVLARGEKA